MKKKDYLEGGSYGVLLQASKTPVETIEQIQTTEDFENTVTIEDKPSQKGMRLFGIKRGVTKKLYRPKYKGSKAAKRASRIHANV